ncbi:MAG: T9SS type A sorting domain-containing protein [Fibrobacterota bacterium]|nr:MAG: T9SS type A sorting domain-containing protein [Fibrobacterota bacterium]
MKGFPFHKPLVAGLVCSLVALAQGATIEAETQTLATGAVVRDSAGVSGGKYVSSNGMTFSVTVDTTGIYDLSVVMWVKQYDWFNSSIFLNNSTTAIATFLTNSPSKVFTTYTLQASGKLTAGKNTITVSGGAANFDALTVVRHPSAIFTLDANPVSPNATESARKLQAFLTRNFGTKTISGMMIGDNAFNYDYGKMRLIETCVPTDSCKVADSLTTFRGQEDIRLFKQRSGEYPALGGFDMLFATGGHSDEGWFRGYTDNNLRMAKELWKLGGIPAFTWHWKVGKDTVFYVKSKGFNNAACKDGVQGSSADNTCFNYTKAFTDSTCAEANPSSAQYKAMMADVDSMSKQFLKLQDSGVAAVWRPLHEAAGGWFWWGIGGSTCYKSLYKLVYDRMVKVNGVRNLIWVWNIERDPAIGYDCSALNPAWYPGDNYVDVIGIDIYNSANDQKSNINCYSKIVEGMGTKKLLALTENGPIPDVDSMATDGAMWSWWMPWYNTWSSGFLNQTPDNVWARNIKDRRILSLGRMPGWANVVAGVPSPRERAHSSLKVDLQGRVLQVSLPNGTAQVSLYDHLGHRILASRQGPITQSYDLRKVARGLYVVRVEGEQVGETRRVVLY